jgi:FkbM family methyltransferase
MGVGNLLRRQLHRGLYRLFEHALVAFARRHQPLHIIQAGANDGKSNDFIHQLIRKSSTRAILVEPVPYVFSQLEKHYQGSANIRLLQAAVTDVSDATSLPFYYLRPVDGLDFQPIYNQWGSFSLDHLRKFAVHVPHFEALLTVENVATLTMNQIMEESGFSSIDIIATDVEGFDGKIITSIDFSRFQPKLLLFEHMHIEKAELKAVLQRLEKHGYSSYSVGFDTVCFHESVSGADWWLAMVKRIRPRWLLPADCY